jgi:hypothetical protein
MKKGDTVTIKKGSYFYKKDPDNPENTIGEIVDNFGVSFKVLWSDGDYNYYLIDDLELVNLKLL